MASAIDVNSPPGDQETHTAGDGDAALAEGDTPGEGSRETSQNCKSQANHPNTSTRRSHSVAADPPAVCIPSCKSRRGKVAGDKLAHCCLCGHRFHTKCPQKTNIQQQKSFNRIGNYEISQLKLASARDKFIFKNAVRVALRTHISGRQ